MFTFMTCAGEEGYVLAQYPAPDTVYKVRVLGDRYLRWTLPGYMTESEIKAELVHYFNTRRAMRGERFYGR